MYIIQAWILHVTVTQDVVVYGLPAQMLNGRHLKHGVQAETAVEVVVVWQASQADQVPMEEKLQKLHQAQALLYVREQEVAVVQ
tara:strand:+ start:87 stop:338 length:252 start_codon:yes stop_codon:yes gene_type:complete